MRLILWAIGCVFAAMAAVQLIIEGMLAAFGGSWTRLRSIGDLFDQLVSVGSSGQMPAVVADSPPWIPALVIGVLFLYLGRYHRPTQN